MNDEDKKDVKLPEDDTDTFKDLGVDAQPGFDLDETLTPDDATDNPLEVDSGMEDVDDPTPNSQPRPLEEELEEDLDPEAVEVE